MIVGRKEREGEGRNKFWDETFWSKKTATGQTIGCEALGRGAGELGMI